MSYPNVEILLRWLHVFAGIIWIGHLYFFNFVNLQLQGAIDDATKKAVNPQLMPRALWWFRWGAMITFLSGMALFTMFYMYTPLDGPGLGKFGPSDVFRYDGAITSRAIFILFGMTLATIMWFNVWFVIWPAQKALLSGQVPAEQIPTVRARAALFSRINTYLSGPMLFGMLAPNHYLGPVGPLVIVVFIAIGAGAIWKAYFVSGKVGKTV